VELFGRFINVKGWYHGIAGYIPVPGDAVIFGGGFGHVAIVDTVNGGQVTVVEEDAAPSGRSVLTLSGSSINGVYGHAVIGVLHAKTNTSPPTDGTRPRALRRVQPADRRDGRQR
jgi:hypothetical protein